MTKSLVNILITGGSGQIAQSIMHHPDASQFNLIACSHKDLDITSMASIQSAVEKFQPSVIINTAAYTAVDKAEQEQDAAMMINYRGAENVAIVCDERDIPLIHLSTDYVFDGKNKEGYKEDDVTHPINFYGKSKLQGEEAIRQYCKKHIILRVSGVFSAFGNNFYKTMQKLAMSKKPIRVVADQITCPTSAHDIAGTLLKLAHNPAHFGTYHYCSTPPISWHAFAEAILEANVEAIPTSEYPTPATRPAYAVLNCDKIAKIFDIQQPSWEHAIWNLQ